jgi:hypothetical protein
MRLGYFVSRLIVVQRHVTPFRVAPERVHKSHFILQRNTQGDHMVRRARRPHPFAV